MIPYYDSTDAQSLSFESNMWPSTDVCCYLLSPGSYIGALSSPYSYHINF